MQSGQPLIATVATTPSNRESLWRRIAIWTIAIPLVGIMGGGIYFYPLLKSNLRSPWVDLLALAALACSAALLGWLAGFPWLPLLAVWGSLGCLDLLIRVLKGRFDLEWFALLHILLILVVLAYPAYARVKARADAFRQAHPAANGAGAR